MNTELLKQGIIKGNVNDTLRKLLTLEEVAQILQIHRETVKSYVQLGKLKGVKVGYKTTRISSEDLQDFINVRRGSGYFSYR